MNLSTLGNPLRNQRHGGPLCSRELHTSFGQLQSCSNANWILGTTESSGALLFLGNGVSSGAPNPNTCEVQPSLH